MTAVRKFHHAGVTVLVYAKSVKLSGMHDCIYFGHEPNEDQIRRMIDAVQDRRNRIIPVKRSLRERFIIWWYGL